MNKLDAAITRRRVLRDLGLAATAVTLAACAPGLSGRGVSASPSRTIASLRPTPDSAATKLVSDVLDFHLRGPFAWNGGSVTMRLHAASFAGQRAYFVRTDASDAEFAGHEGLVWVPLLGNALETREPSVADLYLVEGGVPGQLPVISSVPGEADFTPLFRLHRVRAGARSRLDSVAAIREAERRGGVTIERTGIVVNYPVVKWPGGELPVDRVVERPLEGGPLLEAPDTERMVVTFKLHQCYPESRYIVTDTSAVPMAPMMNIVGSPRTAALAEAHATDTITVFGNGIPGPGVMGFQPAIFGSRAGHPAWSPMWDHWTALWKDPRKAVLVRSKEELDQRVKAREVELHRGTPDTNGQGFVVNCPSPIVAPNDFAVEAR